MAVAIRTIQHYMYCPRRFALLELNRDWAENYFVVKANLMHERVHDGEHEIHLKNLMALSDVWLYNDALDIIGKADCIEFKQSDSGVCIDGKEGRYEISVIEYKPTRPKNNEINESDAIQVFAQKLCVDYIWHCDCKAYLYYADARKRTKLPFDEEYDKYYSKLTEILSGINDIYRSEEIPQKNKGQKCSGCSLADKCMPVTPPKKSLRDNIRTLMEE